MAPAGDRKPLRLAVIGAGPIGLEVALLATQRGVEVEVFEQSESCAGTVEAYHFVTLFSPWSLNTTEQGRQALKEQGLPLPKEDEFPTGRQLIDEYLAPVAAAVKSSAFCRGFHLGVEVVAVGRGALLKGESIGGGDMQMPSGKPLCQQLRRETPFRLLVRKEEKERFIEDFDAVVDCSGFYRKDLGNWLGMGGIPALGERALRTKGRIWSLIPDILGKDRSRFAGKRTLVIGSGMSAATTVKNLLDLAKEDSGTTVLFVTRNAAEPYKVIEDDVLPQRKALCQLGNSAARGEVGSLTYYGGAAIVSLEEQAAGHLQIGLKSPDGASITVEADEVVSCVGFCPDGSLYEELQVHQCYASNGPMKLAATLLGGSGDCLKQVSAGVDALKNPEPGFFILGSKSYGRKSSFLLKIGHEQVKTVLDCLAPA